LRFFRVPWYLLLAIALVVTPAWAAAASGIAEWQQLPSMGETANASLSPGKEKQLGAEAMRQLRGHGAILNDPEVEYYLQSLGDRLVSHAASTPFKIHYVAINNPTVNSFAMPGGYIGIQTGLIAATSNQDELVGVMAHETAHEVQRHIARQVAQGKSLGKLTIASLLAAVAAGALTGNPAVGIAAMGAGTGAALQKRIDYTRKDEEEADRVGIRMMAAAGFDPMAMASFFEHMAELKRLSGGVGLPPILLNHPVNSERIADAESRAKQYPSSKPKSPLVYRLMRARARVLASRNLDDTVRHFQGANESDPAVRYGLALTWAKQGKLGRALKVFESLAGNHPKNVHFALEEAKIKQIRGALPAALKAFQKALQHFRKYPPLILAYVNALEQDKQFKTAWQLLHRSDIDLGDSPHLHRLLAVAANQTQHHGEARYQLAEYFFLQGDYESAIRQLQAGLKETGTSKAEHAKLQDKLKQVQKAAKKNGHAHHHFSGR
jgi:predicted Zn-dependent protease